MKTKKFIAAILALSTVLMGVGYAYWTDSLTIQTKVSTGELQVMLVDVAPYGQYDDETGWSIYDGRGVAIDMKTSPDRIANKDYNNMGEAELAKYEEDAKQYNSINTTIGTSTRSNLAEGTKGPYGEATEASKSMSLTVTNAYPGYGQLIRADIVNTGTVAAKLGAVKMTITKDGEAINDETLGMLGVYLNVHTESDENVYTNLADVEDKDMFTLGDKDNERTFVRLSALPKEIVKVENGALILVNDEQLTRQDVVMGIAMDPDMDGAYTTGNAMDRKANNDTLTQNVEGVVVEAELLWDQFNVGKGTDVVTPPTGGDGGSEGGNGGNDNNGGEVQPPAPTEIKYSDWNGSTAYNTGDIVMEDGDFYIATKPVPAGEDEPEDEKSYWSEIADWKKEQTYHAGNLRKYDKNLYSCKEDHKAGRSFDSSKWTQIIKK